MSNFKFPQAGPKVLVNNMTMTHNDGCLRMNSGGAAAGGYIQPARPTVNLTFDCTVRETVDVNTFLNYVRQYGVARNSEELAELTQEVANKTDLVLLMQESHDKLKEELQKLVDQVEKLRKLTTSYQARNVAMERELLLLSKLAVGDQETQERVAEAAVRSWVISLQEEGEFSKTEILDLVSRVWLLMQRAEVAKSTTFVNKEVTVNGVGVGPILGLDPALTQTVDTTTFQIEVKVAPVPPGEQDDSQLF